MTHRAEMLAARRELLLARSAYQRASLQYDGATIGRRLRFVDTATTFARSNSGRLLLVGGVAILLLTGPARLARVASRLLAVWPVVGAWIPRLLGPTR